MKEFVVSRYRTESASTGQAASARLRVDDRGLVTWADISAESLFGYGGGCFNGMPLRKLVATAEDYPLTPAHDDRLSRGDRLTLTFRHHDGYFFTADLRLSESHVDADHAARATIRPYPETPMDRALLRQIEASTAVGVWELRVQDNRIHWSEGVYRILGLRPGLEIDPEHALFYFQEGQNRVRAALRMCLQSGRSFSLDLPLLTADQRLRQVRLTGAAHLQEKQVTVVTGTLIDRTTEHSQLAAIQHWQRLLEGFIATTDDLVVAMDPQLQIMALNQAFAAHFQTSFGVVPRVGDRLTALLANHPNESRLYQRLWQRAMDRESFCVEMPLTQQGTNLPIYEIHYHRLTDQQGNLVGAAHTARSMHSRLGTEENFNYLSSHDPLTGLLNRRELLQRLTRAIANNADKGSPHALLYLDLDNFEDLNERRGPGACDRYLRELATHLGTRIRQRDALARIGGDKFAVLFDNCDEQEARTVAANLRNVVDGFVFDWRGQPLSARASAGLVPLHRDIASRPEELLALAANLCQSAKNAGRGSLHVYRDRANAAAEVESRDKLEELQKAIETNAIALRFQTIRPIASATWGDYVEILSQLQNSDDAGAWEPADFLPIAECFDLASLYDRLVIGKALTWLGQNPVMEARLKMCSFNLSLASLLEPQFPATVKALVAESRHNPGVFCFEVRESDAARHPEAVETLCRGLHAIGCKVALDGVGGAAQSYALISRLPVDVVKLDARLMKSLKTDPVQQVMVEALQKVAEVSGKITIAQYIEDDQMLAQARELGIHFGQGFRLSRPKPLAELAPPRMTDSAVSPNSAASPYSTAGLSSTASPNSTVIPAQAGIHPKNKNGSPRSRG